MSYKHLGTYNIIIKTLHSITYHSFFYFKDTLTNYIQKTFRFFWSALHFCKSTDAHTIITTCDNIFPIIRRELFY